MTHWIAILSYLLGTLWIVGWATHRALGPTRGQHLQSDWVLAARFIYVFSYLVVFVGGTGVIVFGGQYGAELANRVSSNVTLLADLKVLLGGETAPLAPLFSLGVIHLCLKIEPVNRLDRRVLAWLHSTEHLEDEMQKLRAALETIPFDPSDLEVAENRRKLQDHDVRFTDNRLISGDIAVVTQWRKVACLLRHVGQWQRSSAKVLNPGEEQELRDLEKTDNRKTAHAFHIIRALRHSHQQGQQIAANDIPLRASAEPKRLQAVGGDKGSVILVDYSPQRAQINDTLEMDSEEFAGYIRKIQNYFLAEYGILLHRISTLAAESIVYSGEEAAGRLQKIKEAGFRGLGEINRLTMDNIVKLFCLTIIIVVSVFLVILLFTDRGGPSVIVVWKIGLIYAFAILCGAMIGSNRTLARRPHTPWAAFAAAGFMSFLLFLFVQFSIAMAQAFYAVLPSLAGSGGEDVYTKLSFGRAGTSGESLQFTDVLPWALLPTFASVAICRISRISWADGLGRLVPRLFDGLILAAVFLLVSMLVFALHIHLGTRMAQVLRVGQEIQFGRILTGMTVAGTLGFLMGSTAIADIRKIAKSEI
ncbi:MAG: hypothetical protein ACFCUQ_17685 [Kiloniellales bacterium]